MLLGASFYDSIVGVPLAITILGFRSSTRVIISGMTAGALTTYIWNKYFNTIFPKCLVKKKKILTMVELAQSGIERLVSYSDNLLDLSAFEQRKIVFNIEIHNLKLLAKDVVDEFNKANYNSNHIITFYYHVQAEIIFELDYTRIRQVLYNLIYNTLTLVLLQLEYCHTYRVLKLLLKMRE